MEDNSKSYRSYLVDDFYIYVYDGIRRMDWPSKSSDLTTIEHRRKTCSIEAKFSRAMSNTHTTFLTVFYQRLLA